MYNWSVDENAMKKADPEKYEIWKLEQMINWGLGEEKLSEKKVRKYWDKLNIDPSTQQYLEFLLWDRRPKKPIRSKFQWHRTCRLCDFLRGRTGAQEH